MPNFLQIATTLVERGFSVIPIESGGKRPITGLGAMSRSRHRTTIGVWAQMYPDANVGICADENVVVLETDDWHQLQTIIGNGTGKHLSYALTLMSCGSSDNRPHLFFRRTEMSSNVGNLVVPGLFEARFDNQYVVGPGSVHPSGAVYRFLNDSPMVPIPDWLVSELARLALSQKSTGADRHRSIETSGGRVREGSRHYFLMRELGKMWDGAVSEEHLLEKAHELNAACDPPKDEAHVRQCVRDIMRREPYNAGPKVLIGSGRAGDSNSSVGLDGGVAGLRPVAPSAQEKSWSSVSATELCAEVLAPRQAVMSEGDAPLFYEKSVNQILAWRGVGKTCFGLGIADAIASGGTILNFKADRPRRVLYMDGELPKEQLQERARVFIHPRNRDFVQLFSPEMIAPPRSLNLITNGDANNLMRLVEKGNIEVLFIDSQSTTMGGDTNKTEFQEARQQLLMQLRWAGLTVIEMHHVGKEGKQRGLSRNDDILDVQMHLKKTPDWEPEDGLQFELVYEKVRHAARLESGYVVSLTDGQWLKRPADDVQAVADMLKKRIDIKKIMKELKCSRSKFYRLQKKALAEGLIDSSIELQIGNLKVKKGVPA